MVSQRLSNPAQLVLDSIRRIVRVLRESARSAEERVGLSAAQLFVLQKLDGQRLSLNELAARTLTHQSSVSVVVSRLAARRLVTRRPSPDDARRLELSVSRRGQALLKRAPSTVQDRVLAGLARLPARTQRALAKSLAELVAAMGIDDRAPGMLFENDPPARRRSRL